MKTSMLLLLLALILIGCQSTDGVSSPLIDLSEPVAAAKTVNSENMTTTEALQQDWEYLVEVAICSGDLVYGAPDDCQTAGGPENLSSLSLREIMNRRGSDGWEFVSIANEIPGGVSSFYMIYKRPK